MRLKISLSLFWILVGGMLVFLPPKVIAQRNVLQIKVYPDVFYQDVEHFGASDAWGCQYVGKWDTVKKSKVADLLFSQDTLANGQPVGIGLSLWRFNIGAGSSEQGEASGIKDKWRRAESFLEDSGDYNWDQQQAQLWFLNAAKKRKVDKFLAFSNSPPVQYTRNGLAFSSDGNSNLPLDKQGDFARFLACTIKGISDKTGICFDYVSPVNEPQWKWSDGGQEGSPYSNSEIAALTKSLSTALKNENLSTQINIAEAGKIDYLYSGSDKPSAGNQIQQFFQKNSALYLGNLPNLLGAISGHSYFTTSPAKTAVDQRKKLARQVQKYPNLRYWMSEYCILGDNAGEIEGSKRDLGMTSAIYLAKTIHNDLVYSHATSWSWWLAISPYDYKDGLIYIDPIPETEVFYPSKMLWALGNYSRFIRPGATRIKSSVKGNHQANCQVSAYLDAKNQSLVLVLINSESQTTQASVSVEGVKHFNAQAFVTSSDHDLKPQAPIRNHELLTLAPQSVTTLVIKL